ncbi:hypothetical protein, partial [Escherichia coli]|uniref:hypothetical protein n=1 Tax=Escherichia coli TaxID=562 RepID=UPI00203CB8B5
SLKTSIKTITYLSDIGCLEIQGASLVTTPPARSALTTSTGLPLELAHPDKTIAVTITKRAFFILIFP